MRLGEVEVRELAEQGLIAFLGVIPMAGVSSLAQCGLDKAFGLAVGAWSLRTSEAVTNAELGAGVTGLASAIATSVVGEQAANTDAMLGIKGQGVLQEGEWWCRTLGWAVVTRRPGGSDHRW